MRLKTAVPTSFLLVTLLLFCLSGVLALFYSVTRVSVSTAGEEANNASHSPSLSADFRYVVFTSDATNLVAGDTNNYSDVFIRQRWLDVETTRISVSSAGVQADGGSYSTSESVSGEGRFVIFASDASNLVADDTNGVRDVFLRDRLYDLTSRVSLSSFSVQANGGSDSAVISVDGRYIAFASSADNLVAGDSNGVTDVFVKSVQTGELTRVSLSSTGQQADGGSTHPRISRDGRLVAFDSLASNLVDGDSNGVRDVFVHDRDTGETTRVSLSTTGQQGDQGSFAPAISADGRFVLFVSSASNLVDNDTNGVDDVFVHDRDTGETTRVNVSTTGEQANAASGLQAGGSISEEGRYALFQSSATNLVADDLNNSSDVFIHNRETGETLRISVNSAGMEVAGDSYPGNIIPQGFYTVLESDSANLTSGDFNGAVDVFFVNNPLDMGPTVEPPSPVPTGTSTPTFTPSATWTPYPTWTSGPTWTPDEGFPTEPPKPSTNTPTPTDADGVAPRRNYFTALPLTLTWVNASWAVEYEIWIDTSTAFDAPLTYTTPSPQVTLSSLPDGVYYWRVRARNIYGTWGLWSITETFTLNT